MSPGPSRALRVLAAAGLLALTASCSAGAPAHDTGAQHDTGARHAVPAPVTMRGTLGAGAASTVYDAAIVPAYPLAVQAADVLVHHPAASPPAVSNFTARLSKALASFSAVTAFPPYAERSFATYRAQARSVLADLARPAAVAASEQARRRAALELYALARQIGMLGSDLNLVPATQSGGQH